MLVLLLGACNGGETTDTAEGEPGGTPSSAAPFGPEPVVPGKPTWDMRAQIDTPRDDFAHALVGKEIWTFGGMTGARGTRLTTTEIYDTETDSWRYGPRVPEGLASFEGASVGREVYLFGGLDVDSKASDFAAVLDTESGEWSELPALPHPRYAHDVDRIGDKIYVMGGENSDGPEAAVDVFDTTTQTWSQAAEMPDARSSIDMVPVDGVMYVIGGWLVDSPTAKVQVYDPRDDSWSESTPVPQPVSRGGAAAVGDRIYVSYHEWSYVYDIDADKWTEANPMTVSRHGLGYIAVDGKIYGIGGCTEHPLRDVPFVDVLDVSQT